MKGLLTLTAVIALSACSMEPGREKWCAATKEKPKGEWTGNETKAYAKHCVM